MASFEPTMSENDNVSPQSAIQEELEYDLFFSHSSDDLEYVDELIKTLKDSPYNMRCCWSEDFILGSTTTRNIDHFIRKSMKTVTILSPSFMASAWCDYEVTLLHAMATEEKVNRHLPVLIKTCQLPITIKVNSYLDARELGIHEVCHHIVQSVRQGVTANGLYYGRHNEITVNGTPTDVFAKRTHLFGYEFVDLSQQQLSELNILDIQNTQLMHYKVASLLNRKCVLMQYSHVHGHGRTCLSAFIVSLLIIFAGITIGCLVQDDVEDFIAVYSIVMLQVGSIVVFCVFTAMRRVMLTKADVQVRQFNISLCREHCALVKFGLKQRIPTLTIVNYDIAPCLEVLGNHVLIRCHRPGLLRRKKMYKQSCPLETCLNSYVDILTSYGLVVHDYQVARRNVRHMTRDRLMCFCQFVEDFVRKDERFRLVENRQWTDIEQRDNSDIEALVPDQLV